MMEVTPIFCDQEITLVSLEQDMSTVIQAVLDIPGLKILIPELNHL